ncbi:MAG: hypothetical protein GF387_02375 [Candidatus Portnoybacteria bacterium]|nr:hypothetical protein [Candidatus Portnoybacteria bacterium]
MKTIKITLIILFIGGFILYPNKAFFYSSSSGHPELTREIIKFYNLNYDPDITEEEANLIIKGSMDEDTLPRPAFHLYDPVYNRAPFGVHTAKEWGLVLGLQKPGVLKLAAIEKIFKGTFLHHGDYSWNASIDYFINNNLKEANYGLGHILHLIEDMTVPAHTRNDHHVRGDPFEQWVEDSANHEDFLLAEKLHKQGYRPARLYDLEQAFDELAFYSNEYFFSKDTILENDYGWPKIIKERKEDHGYISQKTYALGKDENGELFRLAVLNFPESRWRKISPFFDEEKVYKIYRYDHKLNRDYWQRLAPRAVIYGAGVIRLFKEEAEIKKETAKNLIPKETFFQKAQAFLKRTFGIKKEAKESEENFVLKKFPIPESKGFPKTEKITEDNLSEKNKLINENNKEEKDLPGKKNKENSSKKENIEKIQELDKSEVKNKKEEENKEEENNSRIVKGPKTGPTGGISWKEINTPVGGQEIIQNNEAQEEDNNFSPDEPEEEDGGNEEENEEKEEEEEVVFLNPASHLVINEIQVKENEFIELYNPTNQNINLANYYFCYYSSARDWNDPYRNKQFPENASISAKGYYLIGMKGYPEEEGNPDADWQIYESRQLSNSAGSIALFPWDPFGKTVSEVKSGVVDLVSWGDVENVFEKKSFQEKISETRSIQRIGFSDTDNNSVDFQINRIPNPTNSKNEQKIPGTDIPDDTVISKDTTWTIGGSPYYIHANANQWPIVEEGAVLTIESGVTIIPLSDNYTNLEIRGTLIAEAEEEEKITFTSLNDFNDNNPKKGDWTGIIFTPSSEDSSIKNVVFKYGGERAKNHNAVIFVDESFVSIQNTVMEESKNASLHLVNSNSEIINSTFRNSRTGVLIEGELSVSKIKDSYFENNAMYGVEISKGASPIVEGNEFKENGYPIMIESSYPEFNNNIASNNYINGIAISSDTILSKDSKWKEDLPYVLLSNKGEYPTVASGSTLTLEPGVVVKSGSGSYITLLINGALIAKGTEGKRIVFTSLKDDSFGGDTNNDQDNSLPDDDDWKELFFTDSSVGSVLGYVSIYYASSEPLNISEKASVDIKETVDY